SQSAVYQDELWRSGADGTPAVQLRGTIQKLTPSSGLPGYVVANGRGYFKDDSPPQGNEPSVSGGSVSGTILLKDITPDGDGSSEPTGFCALSSGISLFAASDGLSGNELWRTDGTADGTSMVMDLNPGPASSFPMNCTAFGDVAYFVARDAQNVYGLWAS